MRKWGLLVSTLPIVLVVAGIKVLLRVGFHFEGLIEFGDVGVVLTGAVFLIGFMLSGVMSDYKESEKLPGELACTLENLEETLVAGAHLKALDGAAMRRAVIDLTEAVRRWLFKEIKDDDVFTAVSGLSTQLEQLEVAGAGFAASKAQSELWNLRKALTRINVIRKTTFLQTGYALLDTLVTLAIVVVLMAKFKSALGEVILVPVVTLIFVYMVRLIRDADDPFDYSVGQVGAAEVDLFPLVDFERRLRMRNAK